MSTPPMTDRCEDALSEESSPALPCDVQGSTCCDSATVASPSSEKQVCLHSDTALCGSSSSLPGSKGHFHGVQKGTGIGKHMHGRGLGRACKLAHQLEVAAAEHIGHAGSLSSPRLLRSPGRKKSPIRWFPRKKTESYLERKIRMLQVKEGNVASLHETLGAANLHLSRVEREKLAAQAAASEAIAARKGALIEASWCRILKLAGIPCKSAISELKNAEKKAAAALAEAENQYGVILQHGTPDQRESASDAVTAALETAFDVDKEVTAAIKAALQQLRQASERALNLQEEADEKFENSDITASYAHEAADSQCDKETKGDCECEDQISPTGMNIPREDLCSKPRGKNAEESNAQPSLVTVMESRIRELSIAHQTALAGIVATHGLSALLKDQSLEQELNGRTAGKRDSKASDEACSPKKGSDLGSILVKHVSRLQREVQASKETNRHLQTEVERRSSGRLQRPVAHIEGLDQILVKHVSKLEKEKLAARAARKTPPKQKSNSVATGETLGLAELLSKPHGQSKTCKEVKEASHTLDEGERKKLSESFNSPCSTGDTESILIKHVSTLEKEKQAAVRMRESMDRQGGDLDRVKLENVGTYSSITPETTEGLSYASERKVLNSANKTLAVDTGSKRHQPSESNEIPDLGSILVKHVSRLEKEKQMALALQDTSNTQRSKEEKGKQSCEPGLKDVLVKRLSKLEIEKANLTVSGMITSEEGKFEELISKENSCFDPPMSEKGTTTEKNKLATGQSTKVAWQRSKAQEFRQMDNSTWSGLSLEAALSSAKLTSAQINTDKPFSGNVPRRKSLREKQMEDEWGGLSLGNALKPHVSKLEKEQAAWKRAEEEARQRLNSQR